MRRKSRGATVNRDINIASGLNEFFKSMAVGSLPSRTCQHGKRSPAYHIAWMSRTRATMTGMSCQIAASLDTDLKYVRVV